MSLLKLLSARRKSADQPTMEPVRFSKEERTRADKGDCILCGLEKAGPNSYLCEFCQAEDSIEDIRDDISALRKKILGPSGGSQ